MVSAGAPQNQALSIPGVKEVSGEWSLAGLDCQGMRKVGYLVRMSRFCLVIRRR